MKDENAPGRKYKAALWIKRILLVALLMTLLLLLFCWQLWQRAGNSVLKIFEAQELVFANIANNDLGQHDFTMENGLHKGGGAMVYSKGDLGLNAENSEEKYSIRFEIRGEGGRVEILPAVVVGVKPGKYPKVRIIPPDAPVGGEAPTPPSPFNELNDQRVILKFAGRYLSLPQSFYDEIETAIEQAEADNGL